MNISNKRDLLSLTTQMHKDLLSFWNSLKIVIKNISISSLLPIHLEGISYV